MLSNTLLNTMRPIKSFTTRNVDFLFIYLIVQVVSDISLARLTAAASLSTSQTIIFAVTVTVLTLLARTLFFRFSSGRYIKW